MSVKMIHPEIEGVSTAVDVATFEQVWAPREWGLLGDAEGYAMDVLGRAVKSLDDLTVGDLIQLNSLRGLPAESRKLAVLKKSFAESFGAQAEAAPADATTDAGASASQNKE